MTLWRDASDTEFKLLNSVLEGILSGADLRISKPCSECMPNWSRLHAYFHARPNGHGGVWIWCSNCKIYLHGSVRPPLWWHNVKPIQEELLTSQPMYLEQFVDQIDQHWAALLIDFTGITTG